MSVDAKAFIKGNVSFEEIEAFLKRTEGNASVKPAGSNQDSFFACRWIEFKDRSGKARSMFAFSSEIPDEGLAEEIKEWVGNDRLTIVSLFSDEEGKRVTREIAARFGGWHQPADSREEYERVMMENPSKAERFAESSEIWKASAKRLAEAMKAFCEETRNLDPSVLETAMKAGPGDSDADGWFAQASAALDAEIERLSKEAED